MSSWIWIIALASTQFWIEGFVENRLDHSPGDVFWFLDAVIILLHPLAPVPFNAADKSMLVYCMRGCNKRCIYCNIRIEYNYSTSMRPKYGLNVLLTGFRDRASSYTESELEPIGANFHRTGRHLIFLSLSANSCCLFLNIGVIWPLNICCSSIKRRSLAPPPSE